MIPPAHGPWQGLHGMHFPDVRDAGNAGCHPTLRCMARKTSRLEVAPPISSPESIESFVSEGRTRRIRAGVLTEIPSQAKNWRAAAPGSAMTHVAITEMLDGRTTDRFRTFPVRNCGATPLKVTATPPTSQGPELFGDIAPNVRELADGALNRAWARPRFPQRDRSLVTVSASTAMNRPDQMRGRIARTWQNGLNDAELIETITQLVFRVGWPNAVTAIIARDVFCNGAMLQPRVLRCAPCMQRHLPSVRSGGCLVRPFPEDV
jgi:alkylhydroperoxidase/carboxymuconolactone decarboxylase family protein YurZ